MALALASGSGICRDVNKQVKQVVKPGLLVSNSEHAIPCTKKALGKRGGRTPCFLEFFSERDGNRLLDFIEEVKPYGEEMWDRVADMCTTG